MIVILLALMGILFFLPKGNIVYVDMDGTLFLWNTKATIADTHVPGFFENSTPDKKAVAAVRILIFFGFRVQILSAAYDDRAIIEKKNALKKLRLHNVPAIFVKYGDSKNDYVDTEGAVLVDDYTKNLKEWKGIPIKYYNGVNGTKGTYKGRYVSRQMNPARIAFRIMKAAM